MIRSLPFSPSVVFTAPSPARREAAREVEPVQPASQDPFNRMLAQQRETARLAQKQATPAQPPASAPEPRPEVATSTAAASDRKAQADDTAKPTPAAAVRSANRSSIDAGEGTGTVDGRPAQIDPDPDVLETGPRHGRKPLPGSDADVLAKLFKTPTLIRPPKQAPIGPEDTPEETPIVTPEICTDKPIKSESMPPLIECPVEPVMAATTGAANPVGFARTGSGHGAQDTASTQALQSGAADDAAAALAGQGGAAAGASAANAAGLAQAASAALQAGSAASGDPAGAAKLASEQLEAAQPAGTSAPAPAAAPLIAGAGGLPSHGSPSTRSATLDARPGSEAFEAKFSAQVAVWVREGVHEAQLQLNPAEMGPVRVAILLEGAAAQVNFSAEHALTRQALEQALPTLAGSLAEAGFTLAGGGVFDQPQQPQEPERLAGDDSTGSLGRAASDAREASSEPQRAAAARPRGVVDLVA